MIAYTKGPWMHNPEGDETVVRIPQAEPQDFSVLGASQVANEEDYANARLIAAAPDLLEALTHLADIAQATSETTEIEPALLQARNAIDKAIGECI